MPNLKINPFLILIIGAVSIAFSPIFVRLSEVDPIMTAFFRIFVSLPFFLMFGSLKIIEKVNFHVFKDKFLIIFISGIFFSLDLILLAFVYQTYHSF